MTDEADPDDLLEACGVVLKHDFVRAAGMTDGQFVQLAAGGVIQVLYRGDDAVGLREDRLPSAEALIAAGVPVPADYLSRLRYDAPDDFEPGPGAATWTMGWD